MQKLMQVQVQKVDAIEDAKDGETKLDAKLDAKHGAKDGTKLGIKLGVKSGAKPIKISGAKLDVRLGAKLGENFIKFCTIFDKWTQIAPKMVSRCKKGSKKGC